MIRAIVFWGLYWGRPNDGNYQVSTKCMNVTRNNEHGNME